MKHFFVKDISLASILLTNGVPPRYFDPVTEEKSIRDGSEVFSRKFWLDISDPDHEAICKETVSAYSEARQWERYELDKNHPVYWMKAVLENRCTWLDWTHNGVTAMTVIEDGNRTIIVGPKLSDKKKQTLKKML